MCSAEMLNSEKGSIQRDSSKYATNVDMLGEKEILFVGYIVL